MQYLIQIAPIGDNLKRLRKSIGLTQSDLVARLQTEGSSMSQKTYSKIETNARNLKVSDLVLLKKVLHATYEDIIEGTCPPN